MRNLLSCFSGTGFWGRSSDLSLYMPAVLMWPAGRIFLTKNFAFSLEVTSYEKFALMFFWNGVLGQIFRSESVHACCVDVACREDFLNKELCLLLGGNLV